MSQPVADVEESADTTIVTLAGELDFEAAAEVREALLQVNLSDVSRIVVDLGAVTFMDSSALGVVIATHQRVTARNATFALRNVPPRVAKILAITALDRVFTIETPTAEFS